MIIMQWNKKGTELMNEKDDIFKVNTTGKGERIYTLRKNDFHSLLVEKKSLSK